MKKKAPIAQPQAEQSASRKQEGSSIPLDLLCDMAWRVAGARNALPPSTDSWRDAVREAHFLIQFANELRKGFYQDAQPDTRVQHAENTILSSVTPEEFTEQTVPFEKGCRLITGDERNDNAVILFRRACERGYLPLDPDQLKEIEANGFDLRDMPDLRATFLRVPRPFLRKNSAKHTE